MEYSLTLRDIMKVLLSSWKRILLIGVIGAILGCGGFLIKGNEGADVSSEELLQNEEAVQAYDQWQNDRSEAITSTSDELISAYDALLNEPIMQLNAYDCTYQEIVLSFDEDADISRESTVDAWIDEEYGDLIAGEGDYLIGVSRRSGHGEVVITIWDNGNYDLESVAAEVEAYVVDKAESNHLQVATVSSTRKNGLSQELFEVQDMLRSNIARIQSAMTTYNATNVWNAPQAVPASDNSRRGLIKYILLGVFVGLLIGCAYAVYRIMKRGIILTAEQAKELLGIMELGVYDSADESQLKMLAMAVDTRTSENDKILLFKDTAPVADAVAEELNKEGSRCYLCANALKADGVSVEEIKELSGAIIPVQLGVTTIDDVQKCILWANRLKRDILGYIMINE